MIPSASSSSLRSSPRTQTTPRMLRSLRPLLPLRAGPQARGASRGVSYAYTAAPPHFGTYDVLSPASAMETYPDPRPVPESIPRPGYVPANFFSAPIWEHDEPGSEPDAEIVVPGSLAHEGVRRAASIAAEVLREVGKMVKPGVTTAELDEAAHNLIVARKAYPSPLGYSHFPRSITTSVNNVIAHGIPDDRPLLDTDIINLDITVFHGGFHGDTSATFLLPGTDGPGRELVVATEEALEAAIAVCKPGVRFSEIGRVIEAYATERSLGVNTQFAGHGIGRRFHQEPWIYHHRNSDRGVMRVGDCFTIEPALTQGFRSRGTVWDDGWTMTTNTGARSAQFEHQLLITDDGVEVLTRQPYP